MLRRATTFAVLSAIAMACVLFTGRTSSPVELCIGGCETHGPPLSLGSDTAKPAAKKSAVRMKTARLQALEDYPDWNQIVQPGEKSIGRPFKEYVPDESVMGKPYEDTPFDKTLGSIPIKNPARDWDFLNDPTKY
mmetsp:Transcript_18532/g.37759  ORF Transcript_18532/g.37759 Transcript_18532/m.37759 type:complete len:135 (+) Transcript_18532:13-417(+)